MSWGSLPLDPTRRHLFRKSVSIYPRSAPGYRSNNYHIIVDRSERQNRLWKLSPLSDEQTVFLSIDGELTITSYNN